MFRTRFAPSPTGPLHLGHAYSALLAHDMARAAGGAFLLRMEDTDLDRCRPEWEAQIIDDLHWLGLAWDGPVQHQADRIAAYNARLEPLAARGLLYPCSCTRADIRAALSAPQEGVAFSVYPGTCRGRSMASRLPGDALRLNLAAACDAWQAATSALSKPAPTTRAITISTAPPPWRRSAMWSCRARARISWPISSPRPLMMRIRASPMSFAAQTFLTSRRASHPATAVRPADPHLPPPPPDPG